MEFYLNAEKIIYEGDPELSLLTYLRRDKGIITPKDGCSCQGACGACTVQLDDRSILSCITPMKRVAGKQVYTTDGIDSYIQHVLAKAFLARGGVQCGFCTPGMVMSAKVLLEKNPSPTASEIESAINKNLCRCTGYKKIIDSILFAAAILRGDEKLPIDAHLTGKVGTHYPKYDSYKTVLGMRPFVADMSLPGMVYGRLKFSDHPRARIKKIDISKAQQLEGVLGVVTAKDVPGQRVIGLIVQDWPLMVAENEITRYVGDVLAGVVAISEEIAVKATSLIEIDYEVLTPICDADEAIKPGAELIQPTGNILSITELNRGDVEESFKNSAFISEGTYYSQRIEHAYLEPECCLSLYWEDHDKNPGVEVYTQGQGVFEDRKQIAKILSLPHERVRVILVPNGGGFGGKEDLSVQGHAALMSFIFKRPVQVKLTREESLTMHPKRHPMRMKYRLGCDVAGKLTALEADIIGDSGAYASVGMKVLERAAGHAASAYHIPVVKIKAIAAYTNNIPCGAMRGFGVNQTAFAIEGCIDDLCQQGGFDRFQFRYDNALTEGSILPTGQILKSGVGVKATLLAVKDEFYRAKYAGIACGIKNTGVGNGMADIGICRIDIEKDERITIYHGWTEMGQGAHTMALQSFCEEMNLPPNLVTVKVETPSETVCGMTTSSRATSLIGHSVKDACQKLKKDLEHNCLKDLIGKKYWGEWRCDWTTAPGKEKPGQEAVTHYSYAYATQVVELDEATGDVKAVYAAQDCGKIMNPTLFTGQVEGAIHMGLGYALTEDFPMRDGRPVSTQFQKCGVLRAKETPTIICKGIEVPDPHGPYGVKGVGEIGLVPTAAAVACALGIYDGVRRYRLPLKRKFKD